MSLVVGGLNALRAGTLHDVVQNGDVFRSRSSLVMSSFLLKVPSGFLSPTHDLFLGGI